MNLNVRYHYDHKQYYLYLDAPPGADGSPQWYATLLTPEEAYLWQGGHRRQLAERLLARGVPLTFPLIFPADAKRQGWLQRLLSRVKALVRR